MRVASALVLGAALLALLALAVPYAGMPFSGEQGVFSYGAWRLAHGEVIYRDFTCHDAAGIYVVHWAAHTLLGWSMPALRRFDLLWTGASFALLALWARRIAGDLAGSLTLLFAVLAYFSLGYQPTAQRDGFALLPFLVAVWIASGFGRGGRDGLRALAVGALVGAMFWIKPPTAALGALFLLPPEAPAGAGRSGVWRSERRRWLGLAAGFLLPAAAWLAYFAAHGALRPLEECLVLYNLQYAGVRFSLPEQLRQMSLQALRFPVYLVGAVALAVGAVADRRVRGLALATALAAAVVAVQGKLLAYHLVPLHLLLCAGAGIGLARLAGARRSRSALAGVLAAGLALSAIPHLRRTPFAEVWGLVLRGEPVRIEREDAKVAALVRQHSAADEPLVVWGIESSGVIPFLAKRRVPVRWVMNYPFSAFDPELPLLQRWRREYLAAVEADPPGVFVVVGNDAYPAIGNLDSREALARFAGLREFLERSYDPIAHIEGFAIYDVYRRRAQPAKDR